MRRYRPGVAEAGKRACAPNLQQQTAFAMPNPGGVLPQPWIPIHWPDEIFRLTIVRGVSKIPGDVPKELKNDGQNQ
jgi:hypothetical protein